MAPSAQLRPRDFALLVLASGDLLPRQRARDQRPDQAGSALQRRILDRLAALEPEPEAIETALLTIVDEIGPPTGPTRAIALSIRDDWQTACATPEWVSYLVGEATQASAGEKRRGRQLPR
jgi:hypothetical protein